MGVLYHLTDGRVPLDQRVDGDSPVVYNRADADLAHLNV